MWETWVFNRAQKFLSRNSKMQKSTFCLTENFRAVFLSGLFCSFSLRQHNHTLRTSKPGSRGAFPSWNPLSFPHWRAECEEDEGVPLCHVSLGCSAHWPAVFSCGWLPAWLSSIIQSPSLYKGGFWKCQQKLPSVWPHFSLPLFLRRLGGCLLGALSISSAPNLSVTMLTLPLASLPFQPDHFQPPHAQMC